MKHFFSREKNTARIKQNRLSSIEFFPSPTFFVLYSKFFPVISSNHERGNRSSRLVVQNQDCVRVNFKVLLFFINRLSIMGSKYFFVSVDDYSICGGGTHSGRNQL